MQDGNEQDISMVSTTAPVSDRNDGGVMTMTEVMNKLAEHDAKFRDQNREIIQQKEKIEVLETQATVYKEMVAERDNVITQLKEIVEQQDVIIKEGRPQDQERIKELEEQVKEQEKKTADRIFKELRQNVQDDSELSADDKKRFFKSIGDCEKNCFLAGGALVGLAVVGIAKVLGSKLIIAATATACGTAGVVILAVAGGMVFGYGCYKVFRYVKPKLDRKMSE